MRPLPTRRPLPGYKTTYTAVPGACSVRRWSTSLGHRPGAPRNAPVGRESAQAEAQRCRAEAQFRGEVSRRGIWRALKASEDRSVDHCIPSASGQDSADHACGDANQGHSRQAVVPRTLVGEHSLEGAEAPTRRLKTPA